MALTVVTVAVVVFLYYLQRSSANETMVVKAKWGIYRGLKSTFEGRHVFSFLGMPFGTNVSAEHRFKRPSQPLPSAENLDAKVSGPPCLQRPLHISPGFRLNVDGGAEDCLHLNLWTPSLPHHVPLPAKTVVVFFYGYGFRWGANTVYDPTPLAVLGDLVVVVPNYRLHAFGFLGDPRSVQVPGNAGLYDQLMALKWTRENVEYFGGDANSIVLHGYEAGAVAVGYHLLSPGDRWVQSINRIILQSGSPFQLRKKSSDMASVYNATGVHPVVR